MLPRCQGGAAAAGVGGWGSRGSERLELCAGGHVRVGVRRLLQSGSLRVAAYQVLALFNSSGKGRPFGHLDEPGFGPDFAIEAEILHAL